MSPLLLIAVVFLAVVAMVMGGWFLLTRYARSAEAQKRRARVIGAPQTAEKKTTKVALFESEEQPKGQWIPRLMERYDAAAKLRSIADQAGVKIDPIKFVHISMGFFLAGYAAGWMMLPESAKLYSIPLGAAAGALPLLNLIRKKNARMKAFEEVFPDTLEFIARSMRAGHAFSVSLEMIHREFGEPLSGEFRRTFEEHNLGLPLDVALQGLGKRVPLLDVHFFVSAVLLQKRTGGNLAEILDKLAYVIRERFKLRGRVKAIAAHGKMTGLALSSIPIGVAILMFFVNPAEVRFFFDDEVGNIMAGAAIGLQLLGYLIIQKIVSIEI